MRRLGEAIVLALAVAGLFLGGQRVYVALEHGFATKCLDEDETDYGFTIPHIDTRARSTQRL